MTTNYFIFYIPANFYEFFFLLTSALNNADGIEIKLNDKIKLKKS